MNGRGYVEVTRPTLETRLTRLRDCRSHGETGLDDEIQTLCQSLTAIDTLTAQRDALAEVLRQLVFEIEELIVDGTLRKADVNEHVSIITARAALAIVDGAR